ncbi:MAG TPA: hypothetical protein VK986_19220, partial [Tepidisphaeraceae bacterium]|nr:hypothetical protein [Tepidisphaeraceae bacterium]
ERSRTRYEAAQTLTESLAKRVDSLKMDMGELSNSAVSITTVERERDRLTAQIGAVREQIEQIMASTAVNAYTELRWHIPPDGTVR